MEPFASRGSAIVRPQNWVDNSRRRAASVLAQRESVNRAERRRRKTASSQSTGSDALAKAIRRHQAGDLDRAEVAYSARLRTRPDDPDALHFLGVLRHQQHRSDEAIALIARALEIVPDHADAWNNLGNVCKESGRLEEAERAYRRALSLDDAHAGAWNNLGVVLGAMRRGSEAVAALQEAVRRAPRMASAWYNLGGALRSCGTLREAIAAYGRALEIDPEHARAHEMLGRVLYLAGEHVAAAAVFRAWASVDPDDPVPAHMLAACSGNNVPARASDAYVRATFDAFADSFDEMLLTRLDYHAPELLTRSLDAVLADRGPIHDVLDAGCGTGLCGALLRKHARALTGVDLSSGMLARARARSVYDTLVDAELGGFLVAHPNAFDVIASADTLCYFGDLAPIVAAAAVALRHGGWLAFTLERADDVDAYRINPHGRYSHAARYVERLLQDEAFTDIDIAAEVLRREAGTPVKGWVVRARRT
jgi:predicted TPR repeat methyltransferase